MMTYRNAISCAWMAGKKEFSAVVVKSFKCFCQIFPVPDSESGQSCGVLELEGHQATEIITFNGTGTL